MAEIKTKVSNASVRAFIQAVPDEKRRADGLKLLKIFQEVTGEEAKMWGESIVGFGSYHYQSERSAQKGDWPLTAFSPRKQNLTLYVMPGFDAYTALLKQLGKHKTSVACLYIKRLSDVDEGVLRKIIKRGFADMKKKYKQKKK